MSSTNSEPHLLGPARSSQSYETEIAALRQEAYVDRVSGVYSHNYFIIEADRLTQHRGPIITLFVDMDKFKDINDTYGHHTGDRLLKITGAIISRNIRGTDCLARVGGDEFAALLPFPNDTKLNFDEKTELLAQHILYTCHRFDEIVREHNHNPQMATNEILTFIKEADDQTITDLITKVKNKDIKIPPNPTIPDTTPSISFSIGVSHTTDAKQIRQTVKSADENMYQMKPKQSPVVETQTS